MECQTNHLSDSKNINSGCNSNATLEQKCSFLDSSFCHNKCFDLVLGRMKTIKSEHQNHLTELFFLQNGGNIMDFYAWKKCPNDLLACFLESEKLDTKDCSSVETLLTPALMDESSQINDDCEASINMSCSDVSFCERMEETIDESTIESQDICGTFRENGYVLSTNSNSVLETSQVQDSIAKLAHQEAQVLKKISEFQKHGLWPMKKIQKSHEPPRHKAHWDYMLEEMQWLANDFATERKTKRTNSKRVSRFVLKYFQDLQQKDLKAEKEDTLRMRKIASNISKLIKEFWSNIEKVVQYKQQSRVDEKRKKALDLHLNFIVDQTEKYSSWLIEGLISSSSTQNAEDSKMGADAEKNDQSCINKLLNPAIVESDVESYVPSDEDVDDEETIVEQEENERMDYQEELSNLHLEGDMPIEELYALYYNNGMEPKSEKIELNPSSIASKRDTNSEQIKTKNLEENISDIAATALSFQPTGNTLETTNVKTPVPFLLKHQLREYQHVGLDWLATMYEQRLNGILADEMGLGKTIQTIALLAFLSTEKGIWGPHLIVVPTSVMLNWEMEFKKWCPGLKILTYYGSLKERKAKRQGWSKTNAFHVCITSYKLVIQDHQAFRRKKWKYFILDEAHNIKNFKSQRWQTLLNFHSQRRLLLTGTPLQNNLMELWSLMHFLMPHVFQSHSEFKEWFSNPLTGMIEGSKEYNDNLIRRLHKVLRPFLLRRLKQDVEKQMPKKYEHVVMCRLSKHQRYLYDDFMSQTKTKETLASGHFMSVINILMQLRKVCNHPNLFDPRPIVSPFHMASLQCTYPSIVVNAFDEFGEQPTKMETITNLGTCLADLELCLGANQAVAIKELCITRTKFYSDFSEIFCSQDIKEIPSERAKSGNLFCDILPLKDEYWIKLKKKRNSEFRLKLEKIWQKNEWRCSHKPLFGMDLRQILTLNNLKTLSSLSWNAQGDIHCMDAHKTFLNFGKQTSCLSDLVSTFDTSLNKLKDIISRFVFVIPPSTAPMPSMNYYSNSYLNLEVILKSVLSKKLNPIFLKLHEITIKQTVQFPDLRLIQYDCGKLQVMDTLLRGLKQDGHRVLIFTQMTKMLDVLEQFLNFHGHRYLRLDGSTKVEQRQVLMERFNKDKKIFCFILSTRSGGVGVNLTGADTVIFYDSDWNPTMDAQAQDRCHRIGQTRDVHIYRLVSEKTIEENILKKANEKRLLGNVAIEGGNFTTAFFKQQTIKELFEEPVGIDLSKGEIKKEVSIDAASEMLMPSQLTEDQIEQALCEAEDETDIQAAKTAKAEQKEELAEFDESLPWDDTKLNETGEKQAKEDISIVEAELAMLDKNLSAIERYAVSFMEVQLAPITNEELNKAEEEVGIAREEWELNHLKAIKEEEERKAEEEEDEMLYVSFSGNYEKKLKSKRLKIQHLEEKKEKINFASHREIKRKNSFQRNEDCSWGKPVKRIKLQKHLKKRFHPDEDQESMSLPTKRFRCENSNEKSRHLFDNIKHDEKVTVSVSTSVNNTAKLMLSRQFQAPNKTIVIQKNLMNLRPSFQFNAVRPVTLPSNTVLFKENPKIYENKRIPILEKFQENVAAINSTSPQPKLINPCSVFIPTNGLFQIKKQNVTSVNTCTATSPLNLLVVKNSSLTGQMVSSTTAKSNVILMPNAVKSSVNIKPNIFIIPSNSASSFLNVSAASTSSMTLTNVISQQRPIKLVSQIQTSVVQSMLKPTQVSSDTVPILEKLAMQLGSQSSKPQVPVRFPFSNPRFLHTSGGISLSHNMVTWTLSNNATAPAIQARPIVTPRFVLSQNICYNQPHQIVILNNKQHNVASANNSFPRFNL